MIKSFSTPPANHHWYAFCTKPHKEQVVNQRLQQQGIITYLPVVASSRSPQPYFPGYLFVQADLNSTGTDFFTWLPGGKGLVQVGECPTIVPDAVITAVKQATAAGKNLEAEPIVVGTAVKIVDGPLAGYEGVVDRYLSGKERVIVLLSLLGSGMKPINMPVTAVGQTA